MPRWSFSAALLLLVAAASAGGCRATPGERLDRLRVERGRADAEEQDILREIDRRERLTDLKLDDYAAAVHAKYDAAKRAYVGPSAETYRLAMSSSEGPAPEAVADLARRNEEVRSAQAAFVAADRKYAATLEPRERAYLDALGKKRAAYHDRYNRKRVQVMTEYEARRKQIDGEIAMLEERRY